MVVRVYVAQKRKSQVRDKWQRQHGNKELAACRGYTLSTDGTPVNIVLNP